MSKKKAIPPNPWLIDAEVRVAPDAGIADRDITGHIVAVDEDHPQPIVTVHLRNGRVVRFLSSQLRLV